LSDLKSIAVPVTRKRAPAKSSSKSKSKTAAPASEASVARAAWLTPVRRMPGPTRNRTTHRFAVGDHVLVGPRTGSIPRAAGAYVIIAALPAEAGPLQYRVRNEDELYERVVVESDISELS
jgi:hypothetical protein